MSGCCEVVCLMKVMIWQDSATLPERDEKPYINSKKVLSADVYRPLSSWVGSKGIYMIANADFHKVTEVRSHPLFGINNLKTPLNFKKIISAATLFNKRTRHSKGNCKTMVIPLLKPVETRNSKPHMHCKCRTSAPRYFFLNKIG